MDRVLLDGRMAAKKLGFIFPEQAPEEPALGPKLYTNHLAYTSLPTFKPSSCIIGTLIMPVAVDLLKNCKSITKVKIKIL